VVSLVKLSLSCSNSCSQNWTTGRRRTLFILPTPKRKQDDGARWTTASHKGKTLMAMLVDISFPFSTFQLQHWLWMNSTASTQDRIPFIHRGALKDWEDLGTGRRRCARYIVVENFDLYREGTESTVVYSPKGISRQKCWRINVFMCSPRHNGME
jgi:hypothetical protein